VGSRAKRRGIGLEIKQNETEILKWAELKNGTKIEQRTLTDLRALGVNPRQLYLVQKWLR